MPSSDHIVREQLLPDEDRSLSIPELAEATQIAFENLSNADRDVVTHYVAAGGRRGWTDACGDRDKANNLRVRLHRAIKKMKKVMGQVLTEQGFAPSEEIVGYWTSPEQMRHIIVAPKPGVREPAATQHYICVTIEVSEEEFDSEARNAIFDHFRFHQIRFSRSPGPSCISDDELAQGRYQTRRPR